MSSDEENGQLWTFLVVLPVRTEHREKLWQMLLDLHEHIRGEPGFLNSEFYEDAADPALIVLRESWQGSLEDLQAQQRRPYRAQYEQALAAALYAPRRIIMLKNVITPGRQAEA